MIYRRQRAADNQQRVLARAVRTYGPEGQYGQMLTYSMVILPVGWLLYSWLKERLASAPLPQGKS